MVEACFLCLDSTEYMRNGDQYPTRMMAEQDAACLLANAKLQANAENTLGFLTTGGNACTVYETLTNNVDAIMTSIGSIPVNGKRCNFSSGLQIASLALSHRTNSRAEKRIVAFVGSPIGETAAELEALAKKLRKDDVAVDVVAFGVESNVELLQAFVKKVSKKENSRFLAVAARENLTDKLMSNAILLGEDLPEGAEGGGANMSGFGVDPNMDPELAMALRLSMEDEMQRQAAAAAAAASSAAPESAPASGSAATPAAPAAPAAAPVVDEDELSYENMSEEEMMRRAIALSLQDSAQGASDTTSPPSAPQPATTSETCRNEEENEDDFAKGVEDALEKEDEENSS
ncbi:proteasome regulatory non-ATP-ase subunit [Leishmania donovani]|uniref:Proteasome_regulatory_non-ATP-ase_subunit_-_putative n=3 Tax=Leishmania donovani species complex TaxID=38574 RepID=A0A6L0WKZ1_LEIIN|nr:putative proteasome regulatory non-ATP-ase subunit [Leishmania infantum JPCM5]XP_003858561.1 proteasome regulatory non-ATP-ase subunit, putative [Leishmania donovani]CAC9449886.1 proteasome_regulatory_non-ATP-ase_subunit_-_putative [Leishmania infantum]AYU76297.1 proteasome regulatory non-ATP-ase subunit, putative [Leishmania donovani]TPP45334.1 von Willebrand factor type A domain family protein [Leishmania donovani]TPP52532.1 von Willebrand factor type A domain family protein [Leishmania d|eukprot:XP_001463329.1 putative proteasome regulatory non-ATP-ase subunit [Leishmania infantum JPCM5]